MTSRWQEFVDFLMGNVLCCDAAVLSVPRRQLLGAHPGGVLAKVSKPEAEALLGGRRDRLLTHGLTLGGLKCTVVRDHLHAEGPPRTMDLRMTYAEGRGEGHTRAATALLVGPLCLILVGQRGVQGGTLNLMGYQAARYLQDGLQRRAAARGHQLGCTSPG